MTKLELLITLDSKGAVTGVKSLNTEVDKLTGTTKKADVTGKGLMNSIFGQVTAANLATKAIGELTAFVKDSAGAFIEAERQQSKLNVVLRRSGEDVGAANKSITAFANQMEYLTGVDNDQIKSLEILARQYEINGDRIDEAIKGAIALTEIGGSLENNLKALANAYNGNWGQLGKLIPEIQAANTNSERMDILQRKVAEGFEISTEAMKGNAGQLKELANWWDDFKKSAGAGIVKGIHLADAAFNGNRMVVKAWAREMATAKQRFDDLAAASINRFKSSSGLKSPPSLAQLGFIDIESDLAAGEAAYKAFSAGIDEAKKSQDDFNASQEKAKSALESTMKAADAALEEMFGLKQNTKDAEAAAEAARELGGIWEIDATAAGWLQENVDRLNGKLRDTAPIEKWYQDAQDLAAGLNALANVFDDLIPGLGGVISGLMGAYEATAKYATASAAGTATLGGFLGMTGAVIGGIIALAEAYEAYIQGQQRDFIIAMNEGIEVTEEMAEKIRLLAHEMEDVTNDLPDFAKKMLIKVDPSWDEYAAATSKYLDEIINATDLTADNFEEYAIRVRDILSDLDRGMLTEAETAIEMGDAFEALIKQANRLGTEGSEALISMFEDLASRGLEVAEITKYINEQWKAGLEGYKLMKSSMDLGDLNEQYENLVESMRGMREGSKEYANALKELDALKEKITDVTNAQDVFGGMNIKIFEDLIAYEKKVGKNQALIDGIHGATQALVSMSNVIRLTEAEFDQFEKSASDAYKKLMEQGFTSKESLLELAPMLSRMIFLNKEYGLTIDATTQALIDKAKQDGIDLSLVKSQDEVFGDMADSLSQLVNIFRNVFPQAINETVEAFENLNNVSNDFNPNTDYIPKLPDEEPAATGWQGWVAGGSNKRFVTGETEPEYVSITPASKMRGNDAAPFGGGSKTTHISITISGTTTPVSVADAIISAYRDNTRGLRSLLEN